jgi:hypothetical protein
MNAVDALQQYLVSPGGALGDAIQAGDAVSLALYAVNSEEYGSQNVLLSTKAGYQTILKRCRNLEFQEKLSERIACLNSLLTDPRFDAVREKIICGRGIRLNGETAIVLPYVYGENAFVAIRCDWRRRRLLDYLDDALDFCSQLQTAHAGTVAFATHWQETCRRFEQAYPCDRILDEWEVDSSVFAEIQTLETTIVHNDFCADNMVRNGDGWRLLDWEYWNVSPAVYNFLDVLFNLSSLLSSSTVSRRSADDYGSLLCGRTSPRAAAFLDRCRGHVRRAGYDRCSPEAAELLFASYLMNKACCQYRVYGRHYHFDRSWRELLDVSAGRRKRVRLLWQALCD